MMDEKDLEVKQMDKKLMRREARRQISDFMPDGGQEAAEHEQEGEQTGFFKRN